MSNQSTPQDIKDASVATRPVADQASVLREMMQRKISEAEAHAASQAVKQGPQDVVASRPRAVTIAVSGGKGGVGKSNVALNLAIALAQLDRQVVLIDANSGHGNADLLCGLNGYWSFEHALSGVRSIDQVLLDGPGGLRILPAADQLSQFGSHQPSAAFIEQLRNLESLSDVLVIDAGIAANESIRQMVGTSDCVLLVTSPEPTSIADTYATIKHLAGVTTDIRVAVNMAQSAEQGQAVFHRIQQTAQSFLDCDITFAGAIPLDRSVVEAVTNRRPFVSDNPDCSAARCLRQLAESLVDNVPAAHTNLFFERLLEHSQRTAA
jgi:flagellar biosynthesis protein FlhG